MKNVREYFVECLKSEIPTFIRVLKAVPSGQDAYTPHPRSTCAGDLAWLLASELHDACDLIEKGEATFVPRPSPGLAQAIAEYERNAAALTERAAAMDDEAWNRPAKFLVDGNVAWEAPLGNMLFGFLFDAIHHRGQLSSYLRPMGGKVPSIYGPSGDDPGQ